MDRSKSPITLAEAADLLGVHYMTAYRYVRTGRLPARKVGQEWQVEVVDVEHLRAEASSGHDVVAVGRGRRRNRTGVLVDRLTRSDEQGAWAIIDDAVRGGMEPDDVYLELLAPALEDVGDRWANGDVTVAEEHQASALVLRLIGRLGPRFARRGRKRGTIVVGAPPGDVHGLPSALISDLLRGRGFEVIDLGGDVPVDSWRSACAAAEPLAAIGMCASTPGNDDAIRDATTAIRTVTSAPVVLGGTAVADEAHALALGASTFSDSFRAAVDLLDRQPPATRVGTPRPAS
jgi:MerR family transcriptional regulator, light-induced transcriptional regulator